MFASRHDPTQLITQGVEPAGTVFIGKGDTGAHLGDVRRRVKAVAFDQGCRAEPADSLAHAGLAATGNTHDDQGSDGLTHVTPQHEDSAVFVRASDTAKAKHKTRVADVFLSFLSIAALQLAGVTGRVQANRTQAIAGPSRQRYLLASRPMTSTKNDKNPRTTGRPTLNEVASLAGVSPITASRALRGISSVATDLVEKVRRAADELNYVVNPAARALASAQSHSVVVLVPSLSNLLFIDTLEAIHKVLRPRGFEVLIGNCHYSRDEEENLLRNYLAYQPRGLLLTGFDRSESARRMIETSNVPCVYMMDLDPGAGVNCVGFSQQRAGATAAEHLISRGRRNLAYIGAQLDQRTLLRGEGFRQALQQAGLYSHR